MTETNETDFNNDDINQFYYTSEKFIRKIDDKYILSKITEKYPDFVQNNDENMLKQVITVIVSDSKLINEIKELCDISIEEIFKILYRNYDYVFNKCFVNKIQKTVKNKKYARKISNRRRK